MTPDAARPTWYLAPGGRPVSASGKVPPGVVWRCREGDREWTQVDPAVSTKVCDRKGWVIAHQVGKFR